MKKLNINAKSGFTIIEVVLVLAVAGLIFLMVFIAVPAMQRSQRDTRRTSDLGRVQAKLIDWQGNHTNKLPKAGACEVNQDDGKVPGYDTAAAGAGSSSDACKFLMDYMNSAAIGENTFQDPSGPYYSLVVTNSIHKTNTAPGDANGATSTSAYGVKLKNDSGNLTIDEASAGNVFDQHVIFVIPGAACEEDTAISSNKNDFAILYRMESQGVKCTGSGH